MCWPTIDLNGIGENSFLDDPTPLEPYLAEEITDAKPVRLAGGRGYLMQCSDGSILKV
jgi:hypothetical protein